jgi:drug/metabolite transporter (DMT)-like permease
VSFAASAFPFVLVTTLSAAVAHATWNSIAHGIKDKLVSFTLVSLGGMICAVPLVLLGAAPSSRSWDYLGVSVALHIVYTVLLMASYRLGDFSQTYPLARGTSPLVVLALAAVFAGETPGPGQFAGVALICAGLGTLVMSGRGAGGYDRRAVLAAIATGLSIASYTTVDGIGVRLSGSVAGYAGWLMLLETAPWPFVALALRRRRLLPAMRPVWPIGLLGGALSVLAYVSCCGRRPTARWRPSPRCASPASWWPRSSAAFSFMRNSAGPGSPPRPASPPGSPSSTCSEP